MVESIIQLELLLVLNNFNISTKVIYHLNIFISIGLGLERLAMIIYGIPDIRLFWSKDSGFLNQFDESKLNENIMYKAVSQYPQCANDLSFWLPAELKIDDFSSNDFYEIVREVGGDIVEHVSEFNFNSNCFHIYIHFYLINRFH